MKPFYEDAAVQLFHGDCRDILPQLGVVDHVITDPPFSEYTHGNAKSNRGKGYGNAAIDFGTRPRVRHAEGGARAETTAR